MYIHEIAIKACKPLPSNHQRIKEHFVLLQFLKLAKNIFTCSGQHHLTIIDYSLYLYMYILNICCSALKVLKSFLSFYF